MTFKSIVLTGVLALSSLTILNAKSYNIVLNHPTKVGSQQLAAGHYSVKVEGDNAVFTDAKTSKSVVTAPVKQQNGNQKYSETAAGVRDENGADRLNSIQLGGSTTSLQFAE